MNEMYLLKCFLNIRVVHYLNYQTGEFFVFQIKIPHVSPYLTRLIFVYELKSMAMRYLIM